MLKVISLLVVLLTVIPFSAFADALDPCSDLLASVGTSLTDEEIKVIEDYKDTLFIPLNLGLRAAQGNQNHEDYGWAVRSGRLHTLDSALDKLPNYEGVVYRGIPFHSSISDLYPIGQIVTEYTGFFLR